VTDPACTASWRSRDGRLDPGTVCGEPAEYEVADTMLCGHHYRRALAWAEKAARWSNSIVYYVRRPDGMIKIGTSRAATGRLGAVARGHGPLLLVALHGGARAEEAAVHRAFKALHIGGEWFRPELPLLEHIAKVRQAMGNLVPEDDGLPPRMTRAEFSRMVRQARAGAAA
jgi:hypothetical protein